MEPYRNRGGPMAEKEYGAERQREGWVLMTHPDLPDNDPINVLWAAVPAKESKGWELYDEQAVSDLPDDAGSWELTEDDD